ncbi:hypothetical protein [Staphylococcus hominis]|uniref:hypothetical protein n=1 Tax=Staphylococcus hominis TaxID=1290 RepID=UPI00066E9E97|nr:hypothetical protein [Staphylococcus hominis]
MIILEANNTSTPAIWSALASTGSLIVAALTFYNTFKKEKRQKKRESPNIILTRKEYQTNNNNSLYLYNKDEFNNILKKWFDDCELKFSLLVTSEQPIYDVDISITSSSSNHQLIESLFEAYESSYNKFISFPIDTNINYDEYLSDKLLNIHNKLNLFGLDYLENKKDFRFSFNETDYCYFEQINNIANISFPKRIYSYMYIFYLYFLETVNKTALVSLDKTITFDIYIKYFNKYESKTQFIKDKIEMIISYHEERETISLNILNKQFESENTEFL